MTQVLHMPASQPASQAASPSTQLAASAPRYAALEPCVEAQLHLLVAQAAALQTLDAFVARLAQLPVPSRLFCTARATPQAIDTTFCSNEDDLAAELLRALAQSTPGTRLYLAGDEAFLWRMHRLAREAGLEREEIVATAIGSQRAVYCVHCACAHVYDDSDEVTCTHCKVRLSVRGHFSERLGAWLGVCADADRPFAETCA
ncbi:dimethylamine monooxygenase subunit DmmA family protein [Paraburkholderia bannensis]|uniref:dimethylamine monooxygenase subunit DmmA family protein n=1 Tax=Paraburkholderia bannensis TaxID=765414 RepID=UPI002ABDDB0E|nr:dimethylamine monooxygenase subunit DmmA family protein [Paraburkholderia bannensis]